MKIRLLLSFFLLATLLISAARAVAADCWVSPDGNDAGPGSKEEPFRTIQKAANIAQPGDTCTVRAGIYREAVTLRNSGTPEKPIRFVAAKGEKVILDGSDPVSDEWTQYRDGIFRTEVEGPVEQVFVDWTMQIEARWPNMRFEEIWDRTRWARAEPGSHKDLML